MVEYRFMKRQRTSVKKNIAIRSGGLLPTCGGNSPLLYVFLPAKVQGAEMNSRSQNYLVEIAAVTVGRLRMALEYWTS